MSRRRTGGPMAGHVGVVTGGGGGIGTFAAMELARQGAVVIALDSGVGLEGEPLHETTAADTVKRIEAEGGTARASTISVTDLPALQSLFADVVTEFGSLDFVVNTAGILRFPTLTDAAEDDWWAVLGVHFGGYLNVLSAALPLMSSAGYGRIVGVTSGAGMARTSPGSIAYGCAKRAVAMLTAELGRIAPPGVTINALSPIAATRMVRLGMIAEGANASGLDLSAMPQPQDMAPAAAYLAGEGLDWCNGQIVFSAGPEISVISPPRLVEAVRTSEVADFASALGTLVPVVLGPAEATQSTSGGSNPRFGAVFDEPKREVSEQPDDSAAEPRPACVIITDNAERGAALAEEAVAWGMRPFGIGAWQPYEASVAVVPEGFDATSDALQQVGAAAGQIAAVIVALGATGGLDVALGAIGGLDVALGATGGLDVALGATGDDGAAGEKWQRVLADQAPVVGDIVTHAAWHRAALQYAERERQPLRIIHVTAADSSGPRITAQAVAQLARSANDTPGPVEILTFAISAENIEGADTRPLSQLVARLARAGETPALARAELVARPGWIGLRRHPTPIATVSFGGPAIPAWVDDCLKEVLNGI